MIAPISTERILEEVRTKPVVPLWPHVGMLLDMSRNGTYAAASRAAFREQYGIIQIGRNLKAVTATLRRRLQLDEANDASQGSTRRTVTAPAVTK